jgi:hypothetical protein
VTSVAFSRDDSRIVSGSLDTTVRVWDAKTGQQLLELTGHADWVLSVAWSSDDSCIVSSSVNNTVRVWDGRPDRALLQLVGHTRIITAVAWNSDGSRIVSGSDDLTVRVWDARTGHALLVLQGHTAMVTSAAFSADGSRIVSTDWKNQRIVWDAATGKRLADAPVPPLADRSEVSPNGQQLLVTSGNSILLVRLQLDDEERLRRWWLMRPDPEWQKYERLEFEKEGNAYAAALHQSFEQRARGALAFENGDFDQAFAHLIAAAALMPQPPPLRRITPPGK